MKRRAKLPVLPKPWRDFHVPIYDVRLVAYRNRKRFGAAMEALGVERDDDQSEAGCCLQVDGKGGNAGSVIYVIGWFSEGPSVLIHEAAHAAMFILVRAGIDPKDSNGEAYCYLLGAVCKALGDQWRGR